MTTPAKELKPCPFCNLEPLIRDIVTNGNEWYVSCCACNMRGPHRSDQQGAVESWNRRPHAPLVSDKPRKDTNDSAVNAGGTNAPSALSEAIRETLRAEGERVHKENDCDCGADDGGKYPVDICSACRVLENLSRRLLAAPQPQEGGR